jgi:hypothetical protein
MSLLVVVPPTVTNNISTLVTNIESILADELEVEWATDPVVQQVATTDLTNLTAGSITPTFPSGSSIVRVLLFAAIHVENEAANTHHITVKIQGQKDGGGYSDLADLTAQTPLGMVNVEGASDSLCVSVDVSSLVDEDGAVYDFRAQVQSDNAGAVNYTTTFVMALVYKM